MMISQRFCRGKGGNRTHILTFELALESLCGTDCGINICLFGGGKVVICFLFVGVQDSIVLRNELDAVAGLLQKAVGWLANRQRVARQRLRKSM